MVRKLASVLVSLAVMSPAWVQALGLGGIELNSFLNQPLDAQIEIISSQKSEADGLRVNLASREAFARAGLEYTNILRQLKFAVVKKPNGKHYIKVTTRKGFREPFLNFLLEANWANGRILREYAELVDPPSLVQSSQTSTQAVQGSRPTTTTRRQSSQAPKPPTFSTAGSTGQGGFIGDTYTTKRNDTAWQIANATRPDDQVTVEQSMMALLRANPGAFIKQNINRLKAGYTLNIPDRDSMLSQSHGDALAEVRQQTREWRDRGRSVSAEPKGRLEILPPKTDTGTDSQTAGTAGGSAAEARREAMLAREAAEAQRQENAELRLRVSELEEQITNAKRLTELKADQLAALEKKLAEMNAAVAAGTEPAAVSTEAEAVAADEAMTEPEAAVTEAPAEDAAAAEAETPVETETAEKEPAQIVEAVTAKPGTPINQHVVSGFEPVDTETLPKSELPAKPFKTDEAAAPGAPVEPAGSLVDKVVAYFKQNPLVKWIVAGAGGLLVLILGILMVRRGRGDQQFEESILQEQPPEEGSFAQEMQANEVEPAEDQFETVKIDEPVDQGPEGATDTSFLSDMVLSDMSDLQGEGAESDPLTEADVFLAYGRFGPAENMIKGAIAKEPERHDLKLKLLEIYYSSKNKEAFEEEAAALHAELENNPDSETWDKVVEMGEDLSPGHSLFAGAATAAAAASVVGDEEDTEIMDFDLGEFEDKIDSAESASGVSTIEKATQDAGLDLDLDEMLSGAEPEEELDDTLEFTAELEGFKDAGSEKTTEITAELEGMDIGEPVIEDPEITRRIVADQAPLNDEITAELEGIADVLKSEDGVSAGDTEITRKIVQNQESVSNEITQELDIPDLGSVDDLASADALPMDEDLDLDDDALADIDEVGTKLDLARAYIDMGDPEGARSILDEVVEEGNDSQRSEAEQLLNQI